MFQQKCPECWNWLINFFDPSLATTSLEGLFKYLIILLIAVIVLYGVFSTIAYASSAAANFARKVTTPVASLVLVIFILIVVSQLRNGKTCRFEEEHYLTQCTPKTERSVETTDSRSTKKSAGKSSWEDATESPAPSKTTPNVSKNSWDNGKETSAPKSSTKTTQSAKSEKPTDEDKSCASKKGAKKQECIDKERDYSEN